MDDESRELLDLWLSGVCKGSASVVAPLLVEEVRRLREENASLSRSADTYESWLEKLDTAAHDYFSRHGVKFPRGTNFGEAASEMAQEAERLRAENERLYRFAMTAPELSEDEAKAIEPGNTAAACRAIDVWNRAAAFKRGIRVLKETRAERDALLAIHVDASGDEPPLWYALLPDNYAPLGMSWQEHETREAAEAAVREAITAPTGSALGGTEGRGEGGE
jgi:hypothetical protein